MGAMYSWATPEYMLDHMSFPQIMMYYDYGMEHEENKSNILVGRIAIGLMGAKEPKKKKVRDDGVTPDKEAFYKQYGDKIKTTRDT
ncbi:hypothetical protein [Paenibacillus sp. NPDC101420]|uniref:hypothetical protein n=1 Tax=Paenibacillus sp. NPDC101420 TaxID=3390602 RepID=UPI003D043DE9